VHAVYYQFWSDDDTRYAAADKVSDCYLVCYLNTLTGDPAYNLTKMAPEMFVGPWRMAFTEDDPAKGGCPAVTPLPCEGHQCPIGG
jgi:hypothetical protein